MDYCYLEQDNTEHDEVQITKSKYQSMGLYQYVYWKIEYDKQLIAPCDTIVHVSYVVDGSCIYKGYEVRKGNSFVFGLNKEPMTSFECGITLFTIDMDASFYYRITGTKPSAYGKQALPLEEGNPFYELGRKLFQRPRDEWAAMAEAFLRKAILVSGHLDNDKYRYAMKGARIMHHFEQVNLVSLCRVLNISYRHLQRQFIDFFGVTPREYLSMLRCTKVLMNIDNGKYSETALSAGYYDQSHMNREVKKLTGYSPTKISQNAFLSKAKTVRIKLEHEI